MADTAKRCILVATDSDAVLEEVDAAIADQQTSVLRVRAGRDVLAAIGEHRPDLVVLDLQIGNMGGVATALALRNEASFGRIADQRVLMLLDREADVFLARRADADGWLIKPIDSLRIGRAVQQVLDGGSFTEGPTGVRPAS